MHINFTELTKNSAFVFITGALGGLFTILVKWWIDIWTSNAKRRQDSITHFFAQIELLAPSYYLMSNHAYLLSWRLDFYLQLKRQLQMTLLDPGLSPYKLLKDQLDGTAAEALFEAGKLYRVITDRFLIDGGEYVVPDQWASKSLSSLHDQIMSLLIFKDNVLLKHIQSTTTREDFLPRLNSPEWDHRYDDLRAEYSRYKDWIEKQNQDVKLLAVYARAYSDLFNFQMKRLYQDVWDKNSDNPLRAREITGQSNLSHRARRSLAKAAAGLRGRLQPAPDKAAPGQSAAADTRNSPGGLYESTRALIRRAVEESDRNTRRLNFTHDNDPEAAHADALLSVGWGYYDAGQWDLAVAEFDKAIEVCDHSEAAGNSSYHAAAYNSLGNAYTQQNKQKGPDNSENYDKAAVAYTRAWTLDPQSALFKQNHGRMLSRRAQQAPVDSEEFKSSYQQAVTFFRQAINLGDACDRPDDDQQSERYSDLGSALAWLNQWDGDDGAIAAYGNAVVLQPLIPNLYAYLAQTYELKYDDQVKQGNPSPDLTLLDAAAGEYSMAAKISTGDDVAIYERKMGAMYSKARRWKDSLTTYQQALADCVSDTEKINTHYEMGLMYQNQGDWASAAGEHKTAFELGGDKNSLHAEAMISAWDKSGDQIPAAIAGRAISCCIAAIGSEPDVIDHRIRLANIYYSTSDFARNLDQRDTIVRMADGKVDNKTMAGYWNQLALAYRKLKITEMARRYYSIAINAQADPQYYKNFGLFLQWLGKYDEAVPLLEFARANRFHDDLDVLLSLALSYAKKTQPNLQAGIDLCLAAAASHPASPLPHSVRADLLVKQGRFIDGAAEYQNAINLNAPPADRIDLLTSGIKAYESAIAVDPSNVALQYGRADMYYQLGDPANAEKGFLTAQQLAGDKHLESISIQNSLARLLYDRGDNDGARDAWELARKINDQLSPEERAQLQTAPPLGPIDPAQISNNLGTTYDRLSLQQKDKNQSAALKQKALQLYSEAALNSPRTFAAHYNLATSLYKQQLFENALSQFQEALRLNPPAAQQIQTLFRIGNCYYRLGWSTLGPEKWYELAAPSTDFPDAPYNLGVWRWENQDHEGAATYWKAALQSRTTLPDIEYNLGVYDLEGKRPTDAIDHWQKIAALPGYEFLAPIIDNLKRGEPTPSLQIHPIHED